MNPRVLIICALIGSLLWLALLWSILDQGFHPRAEPAAAVETIEPDPWTTTTTVTLPDPPTTQRPPTRAHETAPISMWDRVAACESGGRWDDTRVGYEGGLHFMHSTWIAAGGRQYAEHAYDATRAQQIDVARRWLRRTSVAQWPVCGPRVGLTMADAA